MVVVDSFELLIVFVEIVFEHTKTPEIYLLTLQKFLSNGY